MVNPRYDGGRTTPLHHVRPHLLARHSSALQFRSENPMFCRSRLFLLAVRLFAQQPQANYDEAKVPIYTLPDPLTLKNGVVVKDAKTWSAKRRPEILAIYETEVFGQAPARPSKPNYELVSVDQNALGGKAERKRITVYFGGKDDPRMNLLVYLPAGTQKPAPV